MTDNTNAVIFPRVFNLSSVSAVYVAADTLDSAIDHYLKEILCSKEQAIADDMICEPEEIPFEKYKDYIYEDYDGTKRTFEHQLWGLLQSGSTPPFTLAMEEW